MRKYLEILEERGEVRNVSQSVEPRYEISAHLCLNGAGPALRFERASLRAG